MKCLSNEKAERKWKENLRIAIEEGSWEEIYNLAHRCTKETKLRNFHYKLVTRIIPTNKHLFRIKLTETQLCSLCGTYT